MYIYVYCVDIVEINFVSGTVRNSDIECLLDKIRSGARKHEKTHIPIETVLNGNLLRVTCLSVCVCLSLS